MAVAAASSVLAVAASLLQGYPAPRSALGYLAGAPLACLTWIVLARFLRRRPARAAVTVGLAAPFVESGLQLAAVFLGDLGSQSPAFSLELLKAGCATLFSRRELASSLPVTWPLGLATAWGVWAVLGRRPRPAPGGPPPGVVQ